MGVCRCLSDHGVVRFQGSGARTGWRTGGWRLGVREPSLRAPLVGLFVLNGVVLLAASPTSRFGQSRGGADGSRVEHGGTGSGGQSRPKPPDAPRISTSTDHATAAKALEAMTLEMRLACTPTLEAAARVEPVFKATSTPAD